MLTQKEGKEQGKSQPKRERASIMTLCRAERGERRGNIASANRAGTEKGAPFSTCWKRKDTGGCQEGNDQLLRTPAEKGKKGSID